MEFTSLTLKKNYELYKFMEKRRIDTESQQKPNIRSWGGDIKGNFNVDYDEFIKKYEKHILSGSEANLFMVPQKYSHIVIDLDFKINSENWESQYNFSRLYFEDHITTLINEYRQAIKHYFVVDDKLLTAFVLEKDEPTINNNIIKDGFHIEFPLFCVNFNMRLVIRQKVLDLLKSSKLFKMFDNDLDDIIDKSVIKSNIWPIYGSIKPNTGKKYVLTKIINVANEYQDIKKYSLTDLLKILSFFKFSKNELVKNTENYVENNVEDQEISENVDEFENDEYTQKAKELINMLEKSRFDNYNDWIRVGFALYNTSFNLLETWKQISKLSPKYKSGECEKYWFNDFKLRKDGLTIASLEYWARNDNPKLYRDWFENKLDKLIDMSISGDVYDLVSAIHCFYKDEFIFSADNNTWYKFENHKWQMNKSKDDMPNDIFKGLSIEFVDKYRKLVSKYQLDATKIKEKELRDQIDKKIDSINKIISKLRDPRFKSSNALKAELRSRFYVDNFYEMLDQNPYLIGFKNGVYDLKGKMFRNGEPEDFISMSTNIEYKKYEKDKRFAKEIDMFLSQVFPDEILRKFVLTLLSYCLDGTVIHEKLYIFNGEGSNGKSKLAELVKNAFGDYMTEVQNQVITQRKGASKNASPDVYVIKNRRLGLLTETGADDKIVVAQVKELVGGDNVTCRDLFKSQESFKPQMTFILNCNDLPTLDENNYATWRRFRVIDFESTFVDHKPDVKKKQFKIDKKLPEKLKDWAPTFMGLLIDYYMNEYCTNGLIEPERIRVKTDEFKSDNDKVSKFLSDKYIITNNEEDKLSVLNAWSEFNVWFKINCVNEKIIKKPLFTKQLNNILGKHENNYYSGIKEISEIEESKNDLDD